MTASSDSTPIPPTGLVSAFGKLNLPLSVPMIMRGRYSLWLGMTSEFARCTRRKRLIWKKFSARRSVFRCLSRLGREVGIGRMRDASTTFRSTDGQFFVANIGDEHAAGTVSDHQWRLCGHDRRLRRYAAGPEDRNFIFVNFDCVAEVWF